MQVQKLSIQGLSPNQVFQVLKIAGNRCTECHKKAGTPQSTHNHPTILTPTHFDFLPMTNVLNQYNAICQECRRKKRQIFIENSKGFDMDLTFTKLCPLLDNTNNFFLLPQAINLCFSFYRQQLTLLQIYNKRAKSGYVSSYDQLVFEQQLSIGREIETLKNKIAWLYQRRYKIKNVEAIIAYDLIKSVEPIA